MKKFNYLLGSFGLLALLPLAALAGPQEDAAIEAAKFVDKLNTIIIYPTIALLSAVAFFVFLWGCAEYFMHATNDQARQQGVKHITYGIIGLVIMLSAWGLLEIATGTFGLDAEVQCAKDPSDPSCVGVFTP